MIKSPYTLEGVAGSKSCSKSTYWALLWLALKCETHGFGKPNSRYIFEYFGDAICFTDFFVCR